MTAITISVVKGYVRRYQYFKYVKRRYFDSKIDTH